MRVLIEVSGLTLTKSEDDEEVWEFEIINPLGKTVTGKGSAFDSYPYRSNPNFGFVLTPDV